MNKTLNIAHRGFTKEFPDNTLEAFYAAIKLGIDGIECDLHETADHHFVIFNDDEQACNPIKYKSLPEIRKMKIADHYQIPTLEETLDMCHTHIKVMLELKAILSFDLFADIVNAKMKSAELFITSFYPNLVSAIADFAPRIQRGLLTGFTAGDPIKIIESSKARIMLPRFTYANLELVNAVHHHNYSIIVWDCNDRENIRTALDWGVEGIITDSPDVLKIELRNYKAL